MDETDENREANENTPRRLPADHPNAWDNVVATGHLLLAHQLPLVPDWMRKPPRVKKSGQGGLFDQDEGREKVSG